MATQILEPNAERTDAEGLFDRQDVCECAADGVSGRECPFFAVCEVLTSLTVARDQEDLNLMSLGGWV